MDIGIPRSYLVAIAAIFSIYHVVLGIWSLTSVASAAPVIVGMVLYLTATVLCLIPGRQLQLPLWIAIGATVSAIVVTVIVGGQMDAALIGGNGNETWHVAAVGTLMTIVATRRRALFAWAGVAFLVVHTILWAGPDALVALGVIGSVSWVAFSTILTTGMNKAMTDTYRFAVAEREATDWQAAQEAHIFERQARLDHTSSMALTMLMRIESTNGDLTDAERDECLYLEAAIRDEIRGRRLLNDAVRDAVMLARRRGATVLVLDEGGIDDLDSLETARVLDAVAAAVRSTSADRIIVRTASEGSLAAVTVVGLRSAQPGSESDDEVDLWLEIARRAPITRS